MSWLLFLNSTSPFSILFLKFGISFRFNLTVPQNPVFFWSRYWNRVKLLYQFSTYRVSPFLRWGSRSFTKPLKMCYIFGGVIANYQVNVATAGCCGQACGQILWRDSMRFAQVLLTKCWTLKKVYANTINLRIYGVEKNLRELRVVNTFTCIKAWLPALNYGSSAWHYITDLTTRAAMSYERNLTTFWGKGEFPFKYNNTVEYLVKM